METVELNVADLKRWTSLEKVVEYCQHQDRFLQMKLDMLRQIDKDQQIRIWSDLNELMTKAVGVSGGFKRGDYDRLNGYQHQWSGAFSFDAERVHIPVRVYQDAESRVIEAIDLRCLDIEINKRLFEHVFLVLTGQDSVKVCEAKNCHRLFTPRLFTPEKRGYKQIYCSKRCGTRDRMRSFRQRKRDAKNLENNVTLC